jgi:hypothetical protein
MTVAQSAEFSDTYLHVEASPMVYHTTAVSYTLKLYIALFTMANITNTFTVVNYDCSTIS